MPDYEQMYKALFNNVTDVIEALKKAQQDAEDLYIESEEPEPEGNE